MVALIPSSMRVPNPPPLFVGRATEQKWLRNSLSRSPLTLLWGDGGLGKSSLVRHVLHKFFEQNTASTLFLSLRGGDSREHAAIGVLRALAFCQGLGTIDWVTILGAPQMLCAVALERAEAAQSWVFLDDMHHAEAESASELLLYVARYAKLSKWVVTTRNRPVPPLLDYSLTLRPMSEKDLLQLAKVSDPMATKEDLVQNVNACNGSPWRFHQLRSGIHPQSLNPSQLQSLAAPKLRFLQILSLVDCSVPLDLIQTTLGSDGVLLEELESQSLIEKTGEGIRLHEVTRDFLPPWRDLSERDTWRVELAKAFGQCSSAELQIAALSLWLKVGRPDEAGALLERWGQPLLTAGHAVLLWSILEGVLNPELEHWRLTVAVQLGDSSVLARLHEPKSDNPRGRLLWVRVLVLQGKHESGYTTAGVVRQWAQEHGDALLAYEAGLLEARSLINLGKLAQGISLLDSLQECEGVNLAEKESLRAVSLAAFGRREESIDAATRARGMMKSVPWPSRGVVGLGITRALYTLGYLKEASALLDEISSGETDGSVRFDAGRLMRFMRACIAYDRGDLRRAQGELLTLDPYEQHASSLRRHIKHMRACVALYCGDWVTVESHLKQSESSADDLLNVERELLKVQTALAMRQLFEGTPKDAQGSIFSKLTFFLALRSQVRLCSGSVIDAKNSVNSWLASGIDNVELRLVAAISLADFEIMSGAFSSAATILFETIQKSKEFGFTLREIECFELLCDVLFLLERYEELRDAVAEVRRLSEYLSSERFRNVAVFYEAVGKRHSDNLLSALSPRSNDVPRLTADLLAQLESVAKSNASPSIALRARALLGANVVGDKVDQLIIQHAASRGFAITETKTIDSAPSGSAWRSAWGLDSSSKQIWLPNGHKVDLSTKPVLWNVLADLVSRETATKEELVLAGWAEANYHPLKHDNRLQAAIRKLRLLIEDDPSNPERLLTIEDGYRVKGVRKFP